MEINNRITELINYLNLSASDFAVKINVQKSSISHITSGRNKPSIDFIIKLKQSYPKLNIDWILTGIGDKFLTNNTIKPPNQVSTKEKHLFTNVNLDEKRDNYDKSTIDKVLIFYTDGTFTEYQPKNKLD